MQPLVTFSKTELPYRVVLNRRGRRMYGTLEELLHRCEGTVSTVGTQEGNVIMPDIRNSTRFVTYLEFFKPSNDYETLLKALAEQDKRKYVKWVPKHQSFDVIKYEAGGYFNEHYDEKLNDKHYATLLIFPPDINEYAHQGGKLVITLDEGQEFVFNSSENRKWTFIAFRTGLLHRCEMVTMGTRIVIKTELYYSSARAGSPVRMYDDRPMVVDRVRL